MQRPTLRVIPLNCNIKEIGDQASRTPSYNELSTLQSLRYDVSERRACQVVQIARSVQRYRRGAPQRIYCDNGSEFTSRILDLWAYHNRVTLEFSRPGKPTDNGHIESFNGSLRNE